MVQLAKIQEHLLELLLDQIHRRAAVRVLVLLRVVIASYSRYVHHNGIVTGDFQKCQRRVVGT